MIASSPIGPAGALHAPGLPAPGTGEPYADHAPPDAAFIIGIVGGIGPAATVDFMDKLVRNTAARRDQDHLRLLVDHNPAIPDRTAHLTGNGADPTLALYAACRRLQDGGAALIAMPCNTAHAYLPHIQPGLAIPVVNMLSETIAHIVTNSPGCARVGLLATSGTIASRVYHDAARDAPFELLVPAPDFQARVMSAIYGERGVKAGHTSGQCVDDLAAAIAHLARRGATVVILGCTELPLLLGQQRGFDAAGLPVDVVDPTLILARRCIALASGAAARRPNLAGA
ncbi:MAG: amino acid racemase [Pseudomonadota bacterium]